MFIRLIRAEVTDAAGGDRLRRRWESARDRVGGWTTATGGVTAAGQWLAAIVYPHEEAARHNEERPEYGAWWSDLQACFRGPVALEGSADVHAVEGNGGQEAGFVQFMRARVQDRRQWEQVEESIGDRFAALRPDFVGGLRIWHGRGRVTVMDSFRSEAEARAGEAKEMPEDLTVKFGQWMRLLEDVEWYDIADPWVV